MDHSSMNELHQDAFNLRASSRAIGARRETSPSDRKREVIFYLSLRCGQIAAMRALIAALLAVVVAIVSPAPALLLPGQGATMAPRYRASVMRSWKRASDENWPGCSSGLAPTPL